MPEHTSERHLVEEDLAAYWTGRPASTIRRWAAEGRIRRYPDTSDRRNGVRYDLMELPAAVRDPDTLAIIRPGMAPEAPGPAGTTTAQAAPGPPTVHAAAAAAVA
jgi:hypothetical protein